MKGSLLSIFLAKLMTPILLILAFYFYYRGHNLPGGGFVAGLVASTAYIFRALMVPKSDLSVLGLHPAKLSAVGLCLAFGSSIFSFFITGHFFQGTWTSSSIPILGKLGTPMLFDLGVFLTVLGMVTWIVVSTFEDRA